MSKKLLSHGKQKGYKKLLVSTGTTPGVDEIPMQEEFDSMLEGHDDLDKKIVKLGELNELAYEDLLLSLNTSSSVGKVAFGLVKNANSEDFPEGNCKVALDGLASKYALHTALSLLKLKSNLTAVNLSMHNVFVREWTKNHK